MKVLFSISFVFITVFSWAQCSIIPTPFYYLSHGDDLKLNDTITLSSASLPEHIESYISSSLKTVFDLNVVIADAEADIRFEHLSDSTKAEKGAHSIWVRDHVLIRYTTDESCFNAIVSLLQLIDGEKGNYSIEGCLINDIAKHDWRGLHLDVSRHFFSVDEVKRFIDLMALYKFNKFHWHLTDDQGWRIEIKKYPLLAKVGGYRDSTVIGHYSDSPRTWDRSRYGGFYSQEQIREIVQYAMDRHIDVIPEIEMPGHSRAALAAYPEYSCTGEKLPVPGLWGIFDDIYCSKPATINFMKDILGEVITLFPSEYIHIGGDEAPKVRWKSCSACQKIITENGLHDEHELQSYFIGQIDEFLTQKGKKLIGWDEILEGGLSPNAAVMSWRGEKGGIVAAKQKHEVVMSPTTYCYFDYYQSAHAIEPLAIGGYLPLEKVYRFSPIPDELPVEFHQYVLGGQANLWTEYIPNMSHLEYMTYPRALALTQSLWCEKKPSYKEFLNVLIEDQIPFLDRLNVNFSRSIYLPNLRVERVGQGINIKFDGPDKDSYFNVFMKQKGAWSTSLGYVMGREDTLYLERTQNDKWKEVNYSIHSEMYEGEVSYEFLLHEALGLPIELITAPHSKYNNNGSLNLVDGIRGGSPWKGSEWLGFSEETVEFIMELDFARELESISIGFLDNNGSWIYLPENVVAYGSDNKKYWKKLGSVSQVEEANCIVNLKAKKVRYLKVQIQTMGTIPDGKDGAGNLPWTFIDEVFISYKK